MRKLPRNVWVVTATSFLTDISSEMLVHLLPLFLANILGVRTSVIGLIEGVAETTASLLKVFSGGLSDRLGDRKWLAVGGYSLSTLAKPFLLVANTWGAGLALDRRPPSSSAQPWPWAQCCSCCAGCRPARKDHDMPPVERFTISFPASPISSRACKARWRRT